MQQLERGKPLGTVLKATLEGKHAAFIGKGAEGPEVIFTDLFNRDVLIRRSVAAQEMIVHPTLPHLALLSQGKLQIYDVQGQKRVTGANFEFELAYWRFANEKTIVLVTDRAFYRWNYTENDAPKKVFDRHANLLSHKVAGAGMDAKKEFFYILAQQPKDGNDLNTQVQLFSVDRSATQLIEAYQMAFASYTVGSNSNPSTLLVIGQKTPKTTNVGRVCF